MDITPILTSTALAAVVAAGISGFITLRAKHRDYVNEYYGVILRRRISAYEQLENLIIAIKTAVIDSDSRPYHLLFSKADDWNSAYGLILNVNSQALWLSAEALDKTQELNYLVFRLDSNANAIEFGKNNYQKLGELRTDLERIIAEDLLGLHDVKHFLKRKKIVETGLREVRLSR